MLTVLLIAGLISGLAYIRLAPIDVARWHKPVGDADSTDGTGWSARVVKGAPGMLSDLHQTMLTLPRTELLAGSIGEGRLTYITRSKIIGFPDFTTIEQSEEHIKLYARLQFGRSDMGVNGKRLDGLLEQVAAKRAKN